MKAKQSKLDKAKELVIKDLGKAIDKVKRAKTAAQIDNICCDILSARSGGAIDKAFEEDSL